MPEEVSPALIKKEELPHELFINNCEIESDPSLSKEQIPPIIPPSSQNEFFQAYFKTNK